MTGAALVTGGAKRLGRAMALFLAERGHDVVIHFNGSAKEAEEVAGMCRGHGVNAVTVQADLTAEAQMQSLVSEAVDAIGAPLVVLVNSASIFEYDNIETATRESWDRHLESNLRAPFVLTQAPESRLGTRPRWALLCATACALNRPSTTTSSSSLPRLMPA